MRQSTFARTKRLADYRPRQFYWGSLTWLVFFLFPLLPGWLARVMFDELASHGATVAFYAVAGVTVIAEAAMAGLLAWGHRVYVQSWEAARAVAQANVLDAQLASGGPTAGPRLVSPGEAVSRFRDDTLDLLMYADNLVDLIGGVLFGVIAMSILATIDVPATLVALVPLAIVSGLNQVTGTRVKSARQRARESSAEVSSFLGAVTGASLTVKVAGAQKPLLAQLDRLNARRARHAVRDQVLADATFTVNDAVIDLCMGLALVVTVVRARSHHLDAGEIAMFVSYFGNLAWLPRRIGWTLVGRRRFQVSAARLDAMLPGTGTDQDPLTYHRALPILGGAAAPEVRETARVPLERLDVVGLTVEERGVVDVRFTLTRGTLTVVSGPVGSGKSTLLRALLGLVPSDAGEVRWNGTPIDDLAAFMVPPQCAYVAQVPRLFADSLRDNLLLGVSREETDVATAVTLAAFEDDVAGFPEGLATLIGSRGVRLSGGQAQRAAAARALVRRPELLVLDDLTSALDVETEIALWDRLAAEGFTVLAVSNRVVTLARADQILTLA